jgi:pyruvate dehydrogenase complex dehydrogenase (E1) component
MKNKMEDLRNHLFETLEALKDDKNPMDVERARAIRDVGQVLVNSAKVEVDYINATGQAGESTFIESKREHLRGIEGKKRA